jgi:polysaccharide deacetylase family protein (PEP-CTERM system associated)
MTQGLSTAAPGHASIDNSARSVSAQPSIVNALSIDVEDYFQVWALSPHFPRDRWESTPCRVERNVDRILELLAARSTHATFFTLGWVAERYPELIRRIVSMGHELASHGYSHRLATEQTREEFRDDVTRAKHLLEEIGGAPIRGYRAPSFSVGASNPWAFDVLLDAGYAYSSSVYPVQHDHYGMPDAPRFKYDVRPGLCEIPLSTAQFFGRNWPASGGGFFRLLPYAASRWLISRVNRLDRSPAIFYFHPWEIDPEQPRVPGVSAKTRFRHYVNLRHTAGRLERLVSDFRWDRIDRVFFGAPA